VSRQITCVHKQRAGRAIAQAQSGDHGFTIMEVMVAAGISSMLAVVIGVLTVYGERSFALMASSADLDSQSLNALDVLSRELRDASAVTSAQTNLPIKSLSLTCVDDSSGTRQLNITWDGEQRTLTLAKTGQTNWVLLKDCDDWGFTLCDRAAILTTSDVYFRNVTNIAQCKMVNLAWSCSRTNFGSVRTASSQKLQVGLRNSSQ